MLGKSLLKITVLMTTVFVFSRVFAGDMPPRAVGNLLIDPITTAPLQVVYSAEIKQSAEKIYAYISNGRLHAEPVAILRSDVEDGIYAWSNKAIDQAHLEVIHITPSEDGGAKLHWHSFFNHSAPNLANERKAAELSDMVEAMTKKFGGHISGWGHGYSEVNIVSDVSVSAPPRTVWSKSAEDFGNVAQWSSVVGKADSTGDRENAGRTCHINMPGSPSVNETVELYDSENMTFSYSVEGAVMPPFVERATNTWTMEDDAEGNTKLRAHMKLVIAPGAPAHAVGMVKGQFFTMLGMGMEEFDYFVETGKPHSRKLASIEMLTKATKH